MNDNSDEVIILQDTNADNYKKYTYINELYETQLRIDKEISALSLEIENLPKVPLDIDKWVSSFCSNFKISDLNKICDINKKYKKLIEERKSNGSKIKLFAIDNIIDQISEVITNG